MRSEHYKQIAVISETTPEAFETKVNALLSGIASPELVFDNTRPFTVTIIYRVRKDVPETLLELLELMDSDGGKNTCEDCPYFVKSEDKRKQWHFCARKEEKTKRSSRACEVYYAWKRKKDAELIEAYQELPYTVE